MHGQQNIKKKWLGSTLISLTTQEELNGREAGWEPNLVSTL